VAAISLPEFVVSTFLHYAVRPLFGPPAPLAVQRRWLEISSLLNLPPSGVRTTRMTLGGVDTYAYSPKARTAGAGERTVVLYLHGGGFVAGSHRTHAGLAGSLAKALDAVVYLIEYGLAPERPWPAGSDDALAAYRDLRSRGVRPNQIVVAGDSAGGAMVADLLLALSGSGEPMPAAGVMLSAAVGLDQGRPAGAGKRDTLVRPALIETIRTAYGRPTQDPRYAILGRDLGGLPPIYLQFSEGELLAAENRAFLRGLRAAGNATEVHEDAGAFHVLALMPGVLRRSRLSVEAIAAFARRSLAIAQATQATRVGQADHTGHTGLIRQVGEEARTPSGAAGEVA
jgi:monoterpene epsilon-lactone hydrolase